MDPYYHLFAWSPNLAARLSLQATAPSSGEQQKVEENLVAAMKALFELPPAPNFAVELEARGGDLSTWIEEPGSQRFLIRGPLGLSALRAEVGTAPATAP